MDNEIKTIMFQGSEVITAERNGVYYAAMKPICEAIGVNWSGQFLRVKRHPVLSRVFALYKQLQKMVSNVK